MRYLIGGVLIFFLFISGSWATCPTAKIVKERFNGLFRGGKVEVVRVSNTPIKGLCEVVVKARGTKRVLYIDETARYLLVGRIIEIADRKDLTQERLADLNRLPSEKIKKLNSIVAFTVGKGPVVYLITDPDCPHCKRAERILLPLVEKGKITLKVILMPLEVLHPNAKKKAISIICDKKGLKELISGYEGSSCPEGKKKIAEVEKVLREIGVRATPTYVFSDGKMIAGVLPAEKVLSLAK